MAVSFDRLSDRLANVGLMDSDIKSSSSSSLSSSALGSTDISCPSLTASSTSESFSELETDSDPDDIFPSHSPFVGTAHDLTCRLLEPLDEFCLRDENNLATPRPVHINHGSYFSDLEGVDDEWYESGEESLIEAGKWRRSAFKRSKAHSFVRSARRRPMMRRFTSGNLPSASIDKCKADDILEGSVPPKKSTQRIDNYASVGPSRANCPSKLRPNCKTRKSFAGLGLGRPSAWRGETTPKAANGGLSDFGPSLSKKRVQHGRESSMKIVLTPMDSVLAFVEEPSPIEALPSPVLSGKAFPGLETTTAQKFGSDTALFRDPVKPDPDPQIGLGFIGIVTASSERATHECSFKQCADYYSLLMAQGQ